MGGAEERILNRGPRYRNSFIRSFIHKGHSEGPLSTNVFRIAVRYLCYSQESSDLCK